MSAQIEFIQQDMFYDGIGNMLQALQSEINRMPLDKKIEAINSVKRALHEVSPFWSEPVDCVEWVKADCVHANDYNPNTVAPPEMELLKTSITADGYTQPIVGMRDESGNIEVVDGFHRHRVGKEAAEVRTRVHGYLPVVRIRADRAEKADRIAATIRHNRARGKHKVEAMSDIVIELKRRNWSDEKVARELGMDADEVLRLCQITGLAEVFSDQNFSEAWEAGIDSGAGDEILSDVLEGYKAKDNGRILHTWDKWECFKHGFYAERPPHGMSQDQGEAMYTEFLADLTKFENALSVVIAEWKNSCEHYLTNDRMNRVAWLGQASVAQALGIPSICRGGYAALTDQQKAAADSLALVYLNKWLVANGMKEVPMHEATGRTEQELY